MNARLAEVAKDFCEEIHSVEKVIEIWPKSQNGPDVIRLEVLVGHHEVKPTYEVRGYERWEPPQPGGRMIGDAWVEYDIPDIRTAESVNEALTQALGFLRDRFRPTS